MAEGQPDYIETSDRLELVCLPCLRGPRNAYGAAVIAITGFVGGRAEHLGSN